MRAVEPTVSSAAAVLLALFGHARPAFADTPAPEFSYAAAKDCPSGAEFVAAVEARGRHVRVVNDDATGTLMRVSLQRQGADYFGTVRMGSSGGGVREVRGATCHDVLEALAVVTVSVLGPAIATNADETEHSLTDQPEPPRATAPDSAPLPAAAVDRPKHVLAAPAELMVGPGTLRFETDNAMTLFGGVMAGLTPAILPRFDFVWSRTNRVTAPSGESYRLFPTIQLYGSIFANGPSYVSRFGSTEANGLGGGAKLCAPFFYEQTGLQLQLCADLMVGYFGVVTTNAQGVRGTVAIEGVGTAGVELEAAYNVGRHFHFGLKVGGGVILGPLTAQASDGTQIYRSSPFSAHGLLGAGGQF